MSYDNWKTTEPQENQWASEDPHYREYEYEEYLERQQRIADEFSAEYQDHERNG